MQKLIIQGGLPLIGEIPISGAKNAALPLMAASLLSDAPLTLHHMPRLADIRTMQKLLEQHGVEIRDLGIENREVDIAESRISNLESRLTLCASNVFNLTAPYDLVRTMRASVLVLGPLVARHGAAKVSLPGGCAIGARPIDMHLDALKAMGATIDLQDGYVHAHINGRLKGAEIKFEKISVTATENILMAATLALGTTTIRQAAREPEVGDLAECLVKMGAHIEGIGTSTLTIHGVEKLHAAEHSVIPDRIEAGSFACAAAITGGDVELLGARIDHLGAVIEKMREAGVTIEETARGLRVCRSGKLHGIDVMTEPFPNFPTDMQAQFMALLSVAEGASMITETIFENRFMHVPELMRMGANINLHNHSAMVRGVPKLSGAEVMATDLRASLSLVLAALAAEGETVVHRLYHLDRGYENLEAKLRACGAIIERVSEDALETPVLAEAV